MGNTNSDNDNYKINYDNENWYDEFLNHIQNKHKQNERRIHYNIKKGLDLANLNKEMIEQLTRQDVNFKVNYSSLNSELRNDYNFLLNLLKNGKLTSAHLCNHFMKDNIFCKKVLETHSEYKLFHIPKEIFEDTRMVTDILDICPHIFTSNEVDFYSLHRKTDILYLDSRIMLQTAINGGDGGETKFINGLSRHLIKDFDFMLKLFSINASIYEQITDKINYTDTDLKIILKKVPMVLRYLNESQKNDIELVTEAVNVDATVLKYASKSIKQDRRLQQKVLFQLKDDLPNIKKILTFIPYMHLPKDVAIQLVKDDPYTIFLLNDDICYDKDIQQIVHDQMPVLISIVSQWSTNKVNNNETIINNNDVDTNIRQRKNTNNSNY